MTKEPNFIVYDTSWYIETHAQIKLCTAAEAVAAAATKASARPRPLLESAALLLSGDGACALEEVGGGVSVCSVEGANAAEVILGILMSTF